MTRCGSKESIVGSDSPRKRSATYGSSSKIMNECVAARSSSAWRLASESV